LLRFNQQAKTKKKNQTPRLFSSKRPKRDKKIWHTRFSVRRPSKRLLTLEDLGVQGPPSPVFRVKTCSSKIIEKKALRKRWMLRRETLPGCILTGR